MTTFLQLLDDHSNGYLLLRYHTEIFFNRNILTLYGISCGVILNEFVT